MYEWRNWTTQQQPHQDKASGSQGSKDTAATPAAATPGQPLAQVHKRKHGQYAIGFGESEHTQVRDAHAVAAQTRDTLDTMSKTCSQGEAGAKLMLDTLKRATNLFKDYPTFFQQPSQTVNAQMAVLQDCMARK